MQSNRQDGFSWKGNETSRGVWLRSKKWLCCAEHKENENETGRKIAPIRQETQEEYSASQEDKESGNNEKNKSTRVKEK